MTAFIDALDAALLVRAAVWAEEEARAWAQACDDDFRNSEIATGLAYSIEV